MEIEIAGEKIEFGYNLKGTSGGQSCGIAPLELRWMGEVYYPMSSGFRSQLHIRELVAMAKTKEEIEWLMNEFKTNHER